MKFETRAIRTQYERSENSEHSVPIYPTSSFVFENAEEMRAAFADEIDRNVYSRYTNPNPDEFIRKMCSLEGAEAGVATATGMSAVFSSMAGLLKQGDHLLICRSVFGTTHGVVTKYLTNWGIEHTYVNIEQPETWEAEIRPNTRMIFAETPANPSTELIDLDWLGKLANQWGIILNIDNCLATPYLQNPIEYGADLVVHSATKFIDGQGRVLGGAILGKKELVNKIAGFCRSTGPALSPFNAWVLSKSLETLGLRMDRHCSNALQVAEFLEEHPKVRKVRYPFLKSHPNYHLAKKQMRAGGAIVSFYLDSVEDGVRFLDGVQMLSLTTNLGDSRTIVTHPASTTHAKLSPDERLQIGIEDGLVRISVGIEHVDDIISDIGQALARI